MWHSPITKITFFTSSRTKDYAPVFKILGMTRVFLVFLPSRLHYTSACKTEIGITLGGHFR